LLGDGKAGNAKNPITYFSPKRSRYLSRVVAIAASIELLAKIAYRQAVEATGYGLQGGGCWHADVPCTPSIILAIISLHPARLLSWR